MEIYRTEEEQVEALKDWWRENGRGVIVGAILAVAAVFGWRYWQETTRSQAEAASTMYQQMLVQLDAGEGRAVVETARRIIAEYASSPYAALASLSLAQQAVDQGDLDGAAAHLRWVMDNANVGEVRILAQVRLARVLIAQGRADEALQQLAAVAGGSYTVLVEEAKGDAHLAQGRRAEALQAYQTALAGAAEVPAKQQVLRMKLDDLADAGVAAQ